MIMIPAHADTGNSAAQKAMAEEVLGKLASGAEFDRMAQVYSEDSTRDLGGDWGWIERKTLAPALEKIAFTCRLAELATSSITPAIITSSRWRTSMRHDAFTRRNPIRYREETNPTGGARLAGTLDRRFCARRLTFGRSEVRISMFGVGLVVECSLRARARCKRLRSRAEAR